MKNKSLFSQVILLIILGVVCVVSTIGIALLVGAVDTTLFDFRNLNIANMIPILLIGVFISCVIVGIAVLFVGKNAFFQIRDYFQSNDKSKGEKEK